MLRYIQDKNCGLYCCKIKLNKTENIKNELYELYIQSKVWKVFERSLFCLPRLHLFDKLFNNTKNSNFVKYYYNLK